MQGVTVPVPVVSELHESPESCCAYEHVPLAVGSGEQCGLGRGKQAQNKLNSSNDW